MRTARIYQLQREEAVGPRCPYCLALSLPPAPARAAAGHACARRAQSGCNVRAPRVAHHACLRAARSRACAFARAIARASVNAQRKRRTDARCAIARPAPLYFNFPTSVRCSPPPCFFLFVQSPRFPFAQSASDILCSPPRLFPPSSSCARSTIPPPLAPVPLPPPCRPFPTPAVVSLGARECHVVDRDVVDSNCNAVAMLRRSSGWLSRARGFVLDTLRWGAGPQTSSAATGPSLYTCSCSVGPSLLGDRFCSLVPQAHGHHPSSLHTHTHPQHTSPPLLSASR